jgi:hypothetical protein
MIDVWNEFREQSEFEITSELADEPITTPSRWSPRKSRAGTGHACELQKYCTPSVYVLCNLPPREDEELVTYVGQQVAQLRGIPCETNS